MLTNCLITSEDTNIRIECPVCHRHVWLQDGFIVQHREDPPSHVICSESGTLHIIAE